MRVRAHWREIDYWLWLWRERVGYEAKIGLGVAVLVLLLGGGWFAADRLTAAHAGVSSSDSFVLETTVNKVVTVHERGKVVRKVVPVVKKVYLPRETALALRTKYEQVTVPGSVRVVRRLVTTYVPTVKTELIKVNGKTRTVVRTQLVPTTKVETQVETLTQTQTQTRATTNLQTVTDQQTVTSQKTITHTETLPPVTVTQTQTVTVTETQTENHTTTEVQTTTVQGPGETTTVTVTVTVTEPSGP